MDTLDEVVGVLDTQIFAQADPGESVALVFEEPVLCDAGA